MKISLEKNLDYLEDYLSQKGYEIVAESESCDAYIYCETPIAQIKAKNFSPVTLLASDPILLVNAKDKTPEEIEMILTQKSYNKLFWILRKNYWNPRFFDV